MDLISYALAKKAIKSSGDSSAQIAALEQRLDEMASTSLKRTIVDTLPEENINPNTVYMIGRPDSEDGNLYTEFMYIDGAWERIGDTKVDLSNYLQKTDIADWAKALVKPTYTATEVGALPSDTDISDLTDNGSLLSWEHIKPSNGIEESDLHQDLQNIIDSTQQQSFMAGEDAIVAFKSAQPKFNIKKYVFTPGVDNITDKTHITIDENVFLYEIPDFDLNTNKINDIVIYTNGKFYDKEILDFNFFPSYRFKDENNNIVFMLIGAENYLNDSLHSTPIKFYGDTALNTPIEIYFLMQEQIDTQLSLTKEKEFYLCTPWFGVLMEFSDMFPSKELGGYTGKWWKISDQQLFLKDRAAFRGFNFNNFNNFGEGFVTASNLNAGNQSLSLITWEVNENNALILSVTVNDSDKIFAYSDKTGLYVNLNLVEPLGFDKNSLAFGWEIDNPRTHISTNYLVQDDEDILILNCGTSTENIEGYAPLANGEGF